MLIYGDAAYYGIIIKDIFHWPSHITSAQRLDNHL